MGSTSRSCLLYFYLITLLADSNAFFTGRIAQKDASMDSLSFVHLFKGMGYKFGPTVTNYQDGKKVVGVLDKTELRECIENNRSVNDELEASLMIAIEYAKMWQHGIFFDLSELRVCKFLTFTDDNRAIDIIFTNGDSLSIDVHHHGRKIIRGEKKSMKIIHFFDMLAQHINPEIVFSMIPPALFKDRVLTAAFAKGMPDLIDDFAEEAIKRLNVPLTPANVAMSIHNILIKRNRVLNPRLKTLLETIIADEDRNIHVRNMRDMNGDSIMDPYQAFSWYIPHENDDSDQVITKVTKDEFMLEKPEVEQSEKARKHLTGPNLGEEADTQKNISAGDYYDVLPWYTHIKTFDIQTQSSNMTSDEFRIDGPQDMELNSSLFNDGTIYQSRSSIESDGSTSPPSFDTPQDDGCYSNQTEILTNDGLDSSNSDCARFDSFGRRIGSNHLLDNYNATSFDKEDKKIKLQLSDKYREYLSDNSHGREADIAFDSLGNPASTHVDLVSYNKSECKNAFKPLTDAKLYSYNYRKLNIFALSPYDIVQHVIIRNMKDNNQLTTSSTITEDQALDLLSTAQIAVRNMMGMFGEKSPFYSPLSTAKRLQLNSTPLDDKLPSVKTGDNCDEVNDYSQIIPEVQYNYIVQEARRIAAYGKNVFDSRLPIYFHMQPITYEEAKEKSTAPVTLEVKEKRNAAFKLMKENKSWMNTNLFQQVFIKSYIVNDDLSLVYIRFAKVIIRSSDFKKEYVEDYSLFLDTNDLSELAAIHYKREVRTITSGDIASYVFSIFPVHTVGITVPKSQPFSPVLGAMKKQMVFSSSGRSFLLNGELFLRPDLVRKAIANKIAFIIPRFKLTAQVNYCFKELLPITVSSDVKNNTPAVPVTSEPLNSKYYVVRPIALILSICRRFNNKHNIFSQILCSSTEEIILQSDEYVKLNHNFSILHSRYINWFRNFTLPKVDLMDRYPNAYHYLKAALIHTAIGSMNRLTLLLEKVEGDIQALQERCANKLTPEEITKKIELFSKYMTEQDKANAADYHTNFLKALIDNPKEELEKQEKYKKDILRDKNLVSAVFNVLMYYFTSLDKISNDISKDFFNTELAYDLVNKEKLASNDRNSFQDNFDFDYGTDYLKSYDQIEEVFDHSKTFHPMIKYAVDWTHYFEKQKRPRNHSNWLMQGNPTEIMYVNKVSTYVLQTKISHGIHHFLNNTLREEYRKVVSYSKGKTFSYLQADYLISNIRFYMKMEDSMKSIDGVKSRKREHPTISNWCVFLLGLTTGVDFMKLLNDPRAVHATIYLNWNSDLNNQIRDDIMKIQLHSKEWIDENFKLFAENPRGDSILREQYKKKLMQQSAWDEEAFKGYKEFYKYLVKFLSRLGDYSTEVSKLLKTYVPMIILAELKDRQSLKDNVDGLEYLNHSHGPNIIKQLGLVEEYYKKRRNVTRLSNENNTDLDHKAKVQTTELNSLNISLSKKDTVEPNNGALIEESKDNKKALTANEPLEKLTTGSNETEGIEGSKKKKKKTKKRANGDGDMPPTQQEEAIVAGKENEKLKDISGKQPVVNSKSNAPKVNFTEKNLVGYHMLWEYSSALRRLIEAA